MMIEKECYGILDRVFPVGKSGLRETPAECFTCQARIDCMRAAMKTKEGIRMQDALLERSAESGLRGRIKRWSRRKEIERIARDKKKGMSS